MVAWANSSKARHGNKMWPHLRTLLNRRAVVVAGRNTGSKSQQHPSPNNTRFAAQTRRHTHNGMTIGIARETYDLWERRAPLTPNQVQALLTASGNQNDNNNNNSTSSSSLPLRFIVQPSAQRIFPNAAYAAAGATLSDDLSEADVVLGVKRPKDPAASLYPHKTYLFFSHTIKGQPENMNLLQFCLEKHIQLLDYERMVQSSDPADADSMNAKSAAAAAAAATTTTEANSSSSKVSNTSNKMTRKKRLVSFGRFAGLAGALETFHATGQRLLYRDGATTPFLSCPGALQNDSLAAAKDRLQEMAHRLQTEGMPLQEPLVVCVTGKGGTVHGGVMEMLQLLPHTIVAEVSDLPYIFENHLDDPDPTQHQIYIVPVAIKDCFERIVVDRDDNNNNNNGTTTTATSSSSSSSDFDRLHFQNHPAEYRSVFASRIAPYIHVLINAVYWDARFPRLLTKEQTKKLFERGQGRLMVLGDITCDAHGSVEFLERTTTIDQPFFQYDPWMEREVSASIGSTGISVLGVDILPTELPRESSEHFGAAVAGVIQHLMAAKQQQDETTEGLDLKLLPPGLAASCITTPDGHLTPSYRYLRPLLEKASKEPSSQSMTLCLDGHLFDSGLINQVADVVEANLCGMNFLNCVFPAHDSSERTKSSVTLVVTGPSEEVLQNVEFKIRSLVDLIEKADAVVSRLDGHPVGDGMARVSTQREKRVLVLGAGFVSKTCVNRLGRYPNVKLTIVCDSDEDGKKVAAESAKTQLETLDITGDLHRLSGLVEESDLVISLLPAPLHPLIATECLVHRKHFLTASYESEELRSLGDKAESAGCMFINEVGLDPGLDHMSAMKLIHDIQSRNGNVTAFSSFCGGLPAPEAANNPLQYKFSWNPMGVIRASQNDARFRWEGKEIDVPGSQLLRSALPFYHAWPEIDLEYLPNRDSLRYESIYGIEGASTIFRGTLRYHGFSSLLNVFRNMGMFDERQTTSRTWGELLDELRTRFGGFESVEDFVAACSDDNAELTARALEALEWLDLLGERSIVSPYPVVRAFCNVLQEELKFKEGERDMVIMHHTIEASFPEDYEERHHSSLQVFGDSSASAMAKTVGYTTAAAAEVVIDGSLEGKVGLLLPTDPALYSPILEKVEQEGITFTEEVLVNPPSARVE